MNIKRTGPGKMIAIIMISLGIIFLSIAVIFGIQANEFRQQAGMTTAIITQIEAVRKKDSVDHYVYVSYDVRRQSYSGKLNYYTSNMYVGKEVDIYYSLENPADFRADTGNLFEYTFGGIGVLLMAIGLAPLLYAYRKGRLRTRLKQEGRRVDAEITDITLNTSFSYNGRNPYVIICQWIGPTGELHEFKSAHIWFNPNLLLESLKLKRLPVYYDPNNLRSYHMDISVLEQR